MRLLLGVWRTLTDVGLCLGADVTPDISPRYIGVMQPCADGPAGAPSTGRRHPRSRAVILVVRFAVRGARRCARPGRARLSDKTDPVNAQNARTAGRPTQAPGRAVRRGGAASSRASASLLDAAGRCFLAGRRPWSRSPTSRSASRSRTSWPTPGLDRLLRRRQDRAGPARRGDGNRESVPLSKVPEHVQQACSPPRTAASTRTTASRPTGIGRAIVAARQGRPDPGWLDDHPAVRQELLPHARTRR